MHLPLLSRVLFTATALILVIGAHVADYSGTHIFNPRWTPHAKFHTGQTLSFSVLLALMTIWLTWSTTSDYRYHVIAIAAFDSMYWIAQSLAILYPHTAFFDPETRDVRILAIPGQAFIGGVLTGVIVFATWWALRHGPLP